MPCVLVLGLGNVLMGDDALGPFVVKLLEASWEPDPELQLVDAGTPGLDLTGWLAEADAAVVVDVVRAPGSPGEVRVYGKDDLLTRPPPLSMGPHDPGLREALLAAELLGRSPRSLTLVGVIPARVDQGLGLSEPVRAALPAVVERVREALAALGHPPVPRASPLVPDLWWERGGEAPP